ncbi:MAG: LOW QUALITY PROTEIN: hypothetical protein KVP17_000471 [Porospora cf. gigantea B]|uniref:uncharacterized protein n=1 Tax=Porospora cf. gigantea B TaxID=2853592 RepID=UPI00357198A6|nr:MAG: LOW QUALITY PROTEIN: hypothetical protein KVP17_000471 [Porospora cf. gigantea B]
MAVASRNGRHTAEHEAVLSFLVIRGGCVDATDPLSASVLHILCAFGCAAGILYLLADISDHRIFLRPRSLGEFQSILSPLHTVESKEQIGKAIARDPFLVMAVSLLRAHFVLLLNRAGPGFLTPLHYAAASGDPVTVSLLLAAGCNPDMVDARGWTPLFWAALSRSPAVVKLLNVNPLPNDFVFCAYGSITFLQRCRSPLDLVDSIRKPSLARLFTHSDDTTRATTKSTSGTPQASSSVVATASKTSGALLPPRVRPSCAEDALLTVLCVLSVVSAFLSPNWWLVVATASTVVVTGCYLLWHQCQHQEPTECAALDKPSVLPAVPHMVYEPSPAFPQEGSLPPTTRRSPPPPPRRSPPPTRRSRRSLAAGVVAPGMPVRLDKFGLVQVDFSPKPASASPFTNMEEEFLVFSWVLTRIISTYIQSQLVSGEVSLGESPRRVTRSQSSALSSGGMFQAIVAESETEDSALGPRFTEYRVHGCRPTRNVRSSHSRFTIDSIADTYHHSSTVNTDPHLISTVLRKGNSELSATDSADSIRRLHRRPPVRHASLKNNLWDAKPSDCGTATDGSQGGLPQGLTLEIVDGSEEGLAAQLLDPTSLSFACEGQHGSPLPTSHSFPGNLEFLVETVAAARAGSLTARQRAAKRVGALTRGHAGGVRGLLEAALHSPLSGRIRPYQ